MFNADQAFKGSLDEISSDLPSTEGACPIHNSTFKSFSDKE